MGRREAGILLGMIVALLALAFVAGAVAPPDRTDVRPSTFLTSGDGLQALYWTLEELDVPVARRTQPLDARGEDSLAGPVALIGPTETPTPAEMHALAAHVRAGGTLVYAPFRWSPPGPERDTLGLVTEASPGAPGLGGYDTAVVVGRHRWTEGTRRVAGFTRVFADSSRALRGATVLARIGGKPAIVTYRMGRGTVVAFADPAPLGNDRLRHGGAGPVFARMAAEAARGGTLSFDEFHHGFQGEGHVGRGIRRFLARHPAGHATLQLAAVLLLWMLVSARRFGAPLPPPPARRRSPLEHVEALAGAYRQAGAWHTARRLLVAGLARRLGRRAPADERAAGEMLHRLASTAAAGRESAAAGLETEWDRGAAADLSAVARGVDQLLDEVKRP